MAIFPTVDKDGNPADDNIDAMMENVLFFSVTESYMSLNLVSGAFALHPLGIFWMGLVTGSPRFGY